MSSRITEVAKDAVVGGALGGAGGILTGAALTTVSTTSWVFFTTTAVVIAPWALAGFVAAGAVGGAVNALMKPKDPIDID